MNGRESIVPVVRLLLGDGYCFEVVARTLLILVLGCDCDWMMLGYAFIARRFSLSTVVVGELSS